VGFPYRLPTRYFSILAFVYQGLEYVWMLPLLFLLFTQADLYERGGEFLRAGRLAEAEKAYREHLKTHPKHVEALANLGSVLSRKEDFPQAIVQFQKALALRPTLAPLHLNLGLAYFKTRDWARAASEFEQFLKAQPGHRQSMQLRALSLFELERYSEASDAFEALLPGDASIQLGLATAYLRSDRVAQAQKILGPLLEQGNSPEVLLTVGQALFAEERFDEAMTTLLKARELSPTLPTLGLHIGAIHWRKKQNAEAVAEWRNELKAHPENPEAQFTLGAALAMTGGDKIEAERLLRASLARKPKHARANYQLAKLVWQKNRSVEAVTCLEKSIASDPDYREAHYLLANVYQSLGRTADAAREFAAVKRISAKELSRQQDLFSDQP
jgi:tetratricopeptide (TPR) repeat protein